MEHILARLHDLDWDDLDQVQHETESALQRLSGDAIAVALAELPERPDLVELCEHYDLLDKIVLYDHAGIRLRLHVFLPGHFDRPHNHRWTYSSLILRGRYRHYLYGSDNRLHEGIDLKTLNPQLVRTETAGSCYTLHHGTVHAVVAEPYTVSLVLRGPARKERFLVMDRTTGESWWQYGAADEAPDLTAAKHMSPARLADTIDLLDEWNVFPPQEPPDDRPHH